MGRYPGAEENELARAGNGRCLGDSPRTGAVKASRKGKELKGSSLIYVGRLK